MNVLVVGSYVFVGKLREKLLKVDLVLLLMKSRMGWPVAFPDYCICLRLSFQMCGYRRCAEGSSTSASHISLNIRLMVSCALL